MDYGIYPVFFENHIHGLLVAAVYLLERDIIPACDFLHTFETCKVAVGKIVGDHYIIAGFYQLYCNMAADIPGAA